MKKATASVTPKDIDEYLALVPHEARVALEKLRQQSGQRRLKLSR